MWIKLILIALLSAGAQDAGTIRVRADVAGAKVSLDGKAMGEAPLTIGPLAPGTYRVTLTKDGYEAFVQDVQITAAASARVSAILKRIETPLPALPITLRAAHMHLAGVCIGELVLTGEDISYKAENHVDEFRLPIAQMKSVTRAFNSSVGLYSGVTVDMPANMLPLRVELPSKAYNFLVIAGDQSKAPPGDAIMTPEVAEETTKLFQVVYELWQRTLKAKK